MAQTIVPGAEGGLIAQPADANSAIPPGNKAIREADVLSGAAFARDRTATSFKAGQATVAAPAPTVTDLLFGRASTATSTNYDPVVNTYDEWVNTFGRPAKDRNGADLDVRGLPIVSDWGSTTNQARTGTDLGWSNGNPLVATGPQAVAFSFTPPAGWNGTVELISGEMSQAAGTDKPNAMRLWVSDSPGGPAIDGPYEYGGAFGKIINTSLQGGRTYYFNVEPDNNGRVSAQLNHTP